jgi:hypothetical protein
MREVIGLSHGLSFLFIESFRWADIIKPNIQHTGRL